MFKYLLLIFALATIANARAVNETYSNNRVVGGERIEIEQAPWQVALLHNGWQGCGGAIINRNTILTAAHCMHDPNVGNYKIRAGSAAHDQGGVVIKVQKYINHPLWGQGGNDYDISIIKLAEPLNFDDKIARIAPAGPDFNIPDGALATVSGWGDTTNGEGNYPRWLRRAQVPVVSNQYCNDALGGGITKNMICAGKAGKDACAGDSGGPLTYNNRHIGVVSFGIGCGEDGHPGGYMRTSAFKDFIDEHK